MSEQPPERKTSLKKLKTRPLQRNITMTRMGMGAGMRAAGHGLGNLFRDGAKRESANRDFMIAETRRFVDELGQLKGSVMKAGQMLSLYGQYFMPPEAVAILQSLQDDTVHVDWAVVEPVVRSSLGDARMAELDIEQEPIAAASLGQAHVAYLRSDGRKLCLKIRYPGVEAAIDSDIATISRLLILGHIIPQHLSPQPIMAEIREMLHREVDYVHEARMTRSFRQGLQQDRRFIVPRLEDEFCTRDLLLMSYEEGLSLRDPRIKALPQSRRDALGMAFFELFCTEFFDWHMVQTDPHYGNYRIRIEADGERIVLLDFGATRSFDPEFVRAYSRILLGGINRDPQAVLDGSCGIGLMERCYPESVHRDFYQMICQIMEPFCAGRDDVRSEMFTPEGAYLWSKGDVFLEAGKLLSRAAATIHFQMPPREIIFLHRRLAGVYMLLGHLDCVIDARDCLHQALQKFA